LDLALNIEAYVRQLNTMPPSQYVTAVRVAIASANKNVFEVCTAFAGLALLLVLGVKQVNASAETAGEGEDRGEIVFLDEVAAETDNRPLKDIAWTSARLSEDEAVV